jgi:thiamine pyridinylase
VRFCMLHVAHRVLLVACLLAFALRVECNANAANHRTLRVALYPFVPDKDGLFSQVKSSFEHRHPDITLTIVDLSGNYYDESSPGAITNTDADILEVDSVFLDDLVAAGRVQALRSSVVRDKALFAPVARGAMDVGWSTYSIPHWLCTSYLFVASQDVLARAKSFDEIADGIPESHGADQGLLIDLKGRSILGELYLDVLPNRDRSFQDRTLARVGFSTFAWSMRRNGSSHPTQSSWDTHVARVLTELRRMCDKRYCRDAQLHSDVGSYPRLFAHKHGRALMGYSEGLYYIEREARNACQSGECLATGAITALAPPLAQGGARPFAWVQGFMVAKSCMGRCLADAELFINEVTSAKRVRASLIPAAGEAPRYLLPALVALYSDPTLLRAAPLYRDLYQAVEQAIPVRGPHLNRNLRDIAQKLDKEVLPD